MCIELLVMYLAVFVWIGDMYRCARVVFGCVVFGSAMWTELLALYLAVFIWIGDVYRAARVVFGCVYLDWGCVLSCPRCIWPWLSGLAMCIELLVLYLAVLYLDWRYVSSCLFCIWL